MLITGKYLLVLGEAEQLIFGKHCKVNANILQLTGWINKEKETKDSFFIE